MSQEKHVLIQWTTWYTNFKIAKYSHFVWQNIRRGKHVAENSKIAIFFKKTFAVKYAFDGLKYGISDKKKGTERTQGV